jgi:hypothetical protein
MKHLLLLIISIALIGCWNEDHAKDISLGSISLGKQMIDLKVALDQDAITTDEYLQLKKTVMDLNTGCMSEDVNED